MVVWSKLDKSINGHPFEDPNWADYTYIFYLYLPFEPNKGTFMAVDNGIKNYSSSNKWSSVQHIIVVTVTQCMCNCINIEYLCVMWWLILFGLFSTRYSTKKLPLGTSLCCYSCYLWKCKMFSAFGEFRFQYGWCLFEIISAKITEEFRGKKLEPVSDIMCNSYNWNSLLHTLLKIKVLNWHWRALNIHWTSPLDKRFFIV